MRNYQNVIYILTNPLYAGYVKIGYASDLSSRLASLNTGMLRNFETYAVYETPVRNADREYHAIIDDLAPIVRARVINGQRVQDKEFFKLEPEQAYDILKHVAAMTDTMSKLHRIDEPDMLPLTQPYAQQVPAAVSSPAPSYGDANAVSHRRKPATHAVCPSAYRIAGTEYPFVSWVESLVRHCEAIVHAVGFATFKATTNGMKRGAQSERALFSDDESEFKYGHCRIANEDYWMDTNQNSRGIRKSHAMLSELFPNIAFSFVE